MKRSFFQAAVTSILLYGCTTWTLTKRLEKKLDGNYTRMLRAILNKSWQQHPTRHQLYGHLPPITKTIQVRRTRHAGHCWRCRDELIRDVLLLIPTHGCAKAGRPARMYIQQLCEDTGCCPEDLPRAMNDREEWRERVRDIRATSAIWWWWWGQQWTDLEYYCSKEINIEKLLLSEIIWKLQVQSQQPVSLTRNAYSNLTLVPGDGWLNCNSSPLWFKLRDSVETPEFDMKHMRKSEGHIGWTFGIITIKMRSIVWMI